MQYVSTRKTAPPVTFKEALIRGLAPDGGLYIPAAIPQISEDIWRSAEDIVDLASRVLGHWLGAEVSGNRLGSILRNAFNFPVPLVQVGDLYVLELFHGPTHSFKDFGARTMARLMSHFADAEPLTILVATSGDTGSAVADGFAGLPGLRVAVLYPKGQVSALQEKQLIAKRPGVRVFSVKGTFDDCQAMVKTLLASPGALRLSAANSINVGRLLPQMIYYYWTFVVGGLETARICVPSGNLGNLTAGVLAWKSGLPVEQFVAAHNANDGFPKYLAGHARPFARSVRTLSNAMDVGCPSNFERLQALLDARTMRSKIIGRSISDGRTVEAMRRVYEESGYVADPHTAVALEAMRVGSGSGVVLATAHPAKFPETVQNALGIAAPVPAGLSVLGSVETSVVPLDPSPDALQTAITSWS